MEKLYTIPVNMAFERCGAAADVHAARCPFCELYDELEEEELDIILGAAMMEPDVRIRTNRLGFCPTHWQMMLGRKGRLPLALIEQSHLDELRREAERADFTAKRAAEVEGSCYVCGRIEDKFSKMIECALWLWESDPEFVPKLRAQKKLCLPHYRRFAELGRAKLNRKKFPGFKADLDGVFLTYFDSLRGDVDWFCKKFDYRYDKEPWGDAKDAPERAAAFLSGELHVPPIGEEKGK